MRIVSSRVIRTGGQALAPVGPVRAPVLPREGLFLVLVTDEGLEGLGEASPLPGYSPDAIDDAVRALDGIHLGLARLRTDLGAVDAMEQALSPARGVLAASPSACFAVETAMLDLLGRFHRVPVHRVLGTRDAVAVPRSVLLPSPCDPTTRVAARAAIARGIRTVKLKLGAEPFDAERAALMTLRAELGPGVAIRLDANGGLGTRAAERLRALVAVSPAFLEEPVFGEALLDLLDSAPAVPVAADESLAEPVLAHRLLAHPALGAVVVKPALLGLLGARTIALAAARRQLPVVVTHLFDGPIALAACAELALSLPPEAIAACGLEPHPALSAFPHVHVPQVADAAYVVPCDGPGLGLTLLEGPEAQSWRA